MKLSNFSRNCLIFLPVIMCYFWGGGASSQFMMVPYNMLETKAAYLNTGTWADKAQKEAKLFGEVVEVASSKASTYNYIPKGYTVPEDADYFHITTNNTIYGTEIRQDLDCKVPLGCRYVIRYF